VDRREALKKMAVGGVTVIGASSVMSNMAFADGGSANCQPQGFPTDITGSVTITEVINDNNRDRFNINAAITPPACPAGFAPNSSPQYFWTVTGGTAVANDNMGPVSGSWVMNNGVRIVDSGSNTILSTGSYTVRLEYRYVCSDGSRNCWRCVGWQISFDWTNIDGPGGGFNMGIPTATTVGSPNCDSVVPAPA
jgi:hypothetical protein